MKLLEYKKIMKQVVDSSFLSLKDIKIYILKFGFGFRYSARAEKEFFGYTIWINPHYQIYDKYELKGLLAHELCHIEEYIVKGKKWRIQNKRLCKDKKYNTEYEKSTDDRVIFEKGYGKELMKAREKREKIKDKNYELLKDTYYSSEDIKKKLRLLNTKIN